MNIFNQKMALIDFVFLKLRTLKTWLDNCLKSPVSEDPSKGNMGKWPRYCWNLHHGTFLILIDNLQGIWVRKDCSYWHAKSWDCLLTYWLAMASILFLMFLLQEDPSTTNMVTGHNVVEIFIKAISSYLLMAVKAI